MDALLAGLIAVTQFVLGAMGVWVSLRNPKSEHHKYWIGAFVIVGLAGIGLTVWIAENGATTQRTNENAQKRLQQDLDKANGQLVDSRLKQAEMDGHLQGIQTVMENLSKSGWPGMKEFAATVAQITRPEHVDNKQLCSKAHTIAQRLRIIHTAFNRDYNALAEQERREREATGDPKLEKPEIWNKYRILDGNLHNQYDQELAQSTGEVLYLLDQFNQRLGKEAPQKPTALNSLLIFGKLTDFESELAAGYLEELASALCPKSIGASAH